MISELGNISMTEVCKEVGQRWKLLVEEEKRKFVLVYEEKKKKYELEKLDHESKMAGMDSVEQSKPSKGKKSRDPLAPKAPLSSYMEFARQERLKVMEELANPDLVEVGRELGRRWKSLTQEEKEIYVNMSKQNRLRYGEEMKTFSRKRVSESCLDTASFSSSSSTVPLHHPPDSNLDPDCTPESLSSPSTLSPPTIPSPPASTPSPPPIEPTPQEEIKLENLGFAMQNKFSWHPALKTGVFARGTRVKVTFFGTGQSATVDKNKWTAFSSRSEARIATPELMKTLSFKNGLEQLKTLHGKIMNSHDHPVTISGIGFTPKMSQRSFRALNKDHLQLEEEENTRQMEKKMRQDALTGYWRCRDCTWRGKYSHKAKAHARDCGQRKRTSRGKTETRKFDCSHADCNMSFVLKKQLLDHYRYALCQNICNMLIWINSFSISMLDILQDITAVLTNFVLIKNT